MTTATVPRETVSYDASPTHPLRVLELTQEMTYQEIADQLHVSRSTVARKVREAKDLCQGDRNRQASWLVEHRSDIHQVIRTLCWVIITIALSTWAWH